MAIIYFTNNANSGSGSLRAAIESAQPGDVIRPDETVFERGSTIEISLASRLNLNKTLTLDASPCRVRLDGGGVTFLAYILSNANVEIKGFNFVNGCYDKTEYYAGGVRLDGAALFERCLFAGCYSSVTGGALFVGASGNATLNNCVIVGCASLGNGGGIAASGLVTLNDSTVVGNCCTKEGGDLRLSKKSVHRVVNSIVGNVSFSNEASIDAVSSVIDDALSTIGFVVSPPDDLSVEAWNADAWQDWDLRLLDDASPNPSPYRDFGNVGEMSQYDFDGFLRGRKTNNIATCSPGAYETLQADLFWVGRDSRGFPVASPMWTTSSGWSVSRFSKTSGNIIPKYGSIVLINNELTVVPKYKDVVGNVIYFTNNANSGSGSLRAAIASAQPGDIIRPDETVFERGSTIEIALASQLTINKRLTLDASPFRVRLVANGTFRALGTANNVTMEVKRFDFVGGASNVGGGIYVGTNSEFVLDACLIAGCDAETAGGGLFVPSGSRAILLNSLVIGCRAPQGGGVSASGFVNLDGATLIGNTGNNGSDFYAPLSGGLSATNSIIGRVVSQAPTTPKYVGSVVDVASSSVGFVASPPGNLTIESWDASAWQNWDLHLLDDASPNPSPYRDSGDVGEMAQYDLQGNFRGRKTNGVETCSPGAYETLQADLFWIGEPFPQTLIDLAPQDLVASNFVAASETRANIVLSWTIPENADYSAIEWRFATDASPNYWQGTTLDGKAESRKANYVLGRIYTVRIRGQFADGSVTAWSYATFPIDESLNDETGGGQMTGTTLPSALSVVNPSFLTSDGWATSRFATSFDDVTPQVEQELFVEGAVGFNDVLTTANANGQRFALTLGGGANVRFPSGTVHLSDLQTGAASTFTFPSVRPNEARFGDWSRLAGTFTALPKYDVGPQVYIQAARFYSYAQPTVTYGILTIYAQSPPTLRLDGAYRCDEFQILAGTTTSDVCALTSPGTMVRARVVKWGSASSTNAERLASEPITLILQDGITSVIVPEGAPGSWSDNFIVDVSESASTTLTLSGQTVYGDAPTASVELVGSAKIGKGGFNVALLTLNDNAVLTIEAKNFSAKSINLRTSSVLNINDAWIYVPNLVADDNATINFSGVDAILTVTEVATIGAANFTGTGYFVSPQDTDLTSAALAETVRHVDYFAGVTDFVATAAGATNAMLTWVATDETLKICIERENRSKPEGWEIVALTTSAETPLNVALSGHERFRIFDGSSFLYDDAYFTVKSFYVYSISSTQKDVESLALYSKKTQIIRAHMEGTRNENILLLAQIKNLLTGEFLSTTNVDNIKASVYKINKSISSGDIWEKQEEWAEVVVEKEAILEEPVMIDGWTNDDAGANFIWTPDTRNKSLFKDGGRYVIQVTFNLINDNPIVISFNVNVK